MMDNMDIVQSRLSGSCEICNGSLPVHRMGCPQLHKYYGQFGITSPEQFEEFNRKRTLHRQLDLFEDI